MESLRKGGEVWVAALRRGKAHLLRKCNWMARQCGIPSGACYHEICMKLASPNVEVFSSVIQLFECCHGKG